MFLIILNTTRMLIVLHTVNNASYIDVVGLYTHIHIFGRIVFYTRMYVLPNGHEFCWFLCIYSNVFAYLRLAG